MNKHIELVKKWLADPESVSLEELEANREAAWDNWAAGATRATIAAYWAAWAAVEAAWAAEATAAAEAVKAAIAAEAAYKGGVKANRDAYWRNCASEYVKQYEELTK
jgi:hypothetical protein